jgi:hypothetical protein
MGIWPFGKSDDEHNKPGDTSYGATVSEGDEQQEEEEKENEEDLGIIPDDDRLKQMTDMQLVMRVLADLYNQWMDDNLSNELRKRSDERTFDEHHKEKNND